MIAEAVQAAQEVAKVNPLVDAGIYGLLITNSFMILRDVLKNRTEKQKAKAAAEEAEAQALKAQAQALSKKPSGAGDNPNGHEKFILPHTEMLMRHDGELKALTASTSRFERENREDHGKLFDGISDLKDLIIERLPRAN